MPSEFVHLHLHTQYSLLDGANQLNPLFQQVKDYGMPAVAMTDHGNLFGRHRFLSKSQESWHQTHYRLRSLYGPW